MSSTARPDKFNIQVTVHTPKEAQGRGDCIVHNLDNDLVAENEEEQVAETPLAMLEAAGPSVPRVTRAKRVWTRLDCRRPYLQDTTTSVIWVVMTPRAFVLVCMVISSGSGAENPQNDRRDVNSINHWC